MAEENPQLQSKAQIALLVTAPLFVNWLFNGLYVNELQANPPLFFMVDALAFVIGPLLALVYLTKFRVLTPSELGFCRQKNQSFTNQLFDCIWLATVWFGLLWWGMPYLDSQLQGLDWINSFNPPVTYSSFYQGWIAWLVIIYYAVGAAFAEEFYFRGILHFSITRLVDARAANFMYVASSSILFGVTHWEGGLVKVVVVLAIGVLTASYFSFKKTLLPLIGAHFVVDLVIGVQHQLAISTS